MRHSWPIDFSAGSYVAIRSRDLRSTEKPLPPAIAWKVLQRFCRRPEAPEQLAALGQAVDPTARRGISISLQALEAAFLSGEFLLLVRGNSLSAPRAASASGENVAEQLKKAQAVKTWVEFEVIDSAGKPCSNLRFTCLMPGGNVEEGTLDSRGRARFDGIDPGNCSFTLVDLDNQAWERIG